ncbi:MAG: hypothetical protein ANABAC_2473 [Anaerolineae bacterium]|jgi:hypothetical protein|nr:MAG: hypothetical protein ANABAC_2473 [Anaerolineae bacterium]
MNEVEINLRILKRFEPILRYTRGERFFPVDVEWYISQCSLWVKPPGKPAQELVPQGELTLELLTRDWNLEQGSVLYLKFVEPLDVLKLARQSIAEAVERLTHHTIEEIFYPGRARLARVGYGSRLIDALFNLSLFWRGRVPGDTAATAAYLYRQRQAQQERYCYYGRVLRENGWIILQYWYFYPFNNWRSGFFGVNDHEGDWEMVSIYCVESTSSSETTTSSHSLIAPDDLIPLWVAYASHDFEGDDLRRHWTDPELEKVGDHPVVYVGAGSHASYFQKGEYMSEVELPFLRPLALVVDRLQSVWVDFLRQAGSKESQKSFFTFRVPFVDYARGDGLVIGAGGTKQWEAILFDENTPWACRYHGLWGLYAEDPIAGENAPAGPIYDRDGNFRRCWIDPLGWAGLDKVTPPHQLIPRIEEQLRALDTQIQTLEKEIRQKTQEIQRLEVIHQALATQPQQQKACLDLNKKITIAAKDLWGSRRELAETRRVYQLVQSYRQQILDGKPPLIRAHIRHRHEPLPDTSNLNILAEGVATLSVGILLIGVVLLWWFERPYFLIGLAVLIGSLVFIEAGFRGQLARLINSISIGLAIVSAFVLLFHFFWQIVLVGVLFAGLFLLWQNFRELRR